MDPRPLQLAGFKLPYNSVEEIRDRMGELAPHLLRCGDLQEANFFALANKLLTVRRNNPRIVIVCV